MNCPACGSAAGWHVPGSPGCLDKIRGSLAKAHQRYYEKVMENGKYHKASILGYRRLKRVELKMKSAMQ